MARILGESIDLSRQAQVKATLLTTVADVRPGAAIPASTGKK
jgi:hypothetical protein